MARAASDYRAARRNEWRQGARLAAYGEFKRALPPWGGKAVSNARFRPYVARGKLYSYRGKR